MSLREFASPFPSTKKSLPDREFASTAPSGRGQTGGSAGSHRTDNPDSRGRMGKLPRPLRQSPDAPGSPSAAPDVDASRFQHSFVYTDDDRDEYAEKLAKSEVRPERSLVDMLSSAEDWLEDNEDATGSGTNDAKKNESLRRFIGLQLEGDIPLFVEGQTHRLRKDLNLQTLSHGYSGGPSWGERRWDRRDLDVVVVRQGTELVLRTDSEGRITGQQNRAYGVSSPIYQLEPEHLRWVEQTTFPAKASGARWVVDIAKPKLVRKKKKKSSCSKPVAFESWSCLVDEDEDVDKKAKKRGQKKTKEVNTVSAGGISGYTLPLGASNQTRKARKKNAGINARAFGGGKVVGKL